MQRDLKRLQEAGIQVVGISFDDAKVLNVAANRLKISFPLLSDPESKTIENYHIKNSSAKGKADGVPYPGTFILDSKGFIRAKLFLEGFRARHSTDALIQAASALN